MPRLFCYHMSNISIDDCIVIFSLQHPIHVPSRKRYKSVDLANNAKFSK